MLHFLGKPENGVDNDSFGLSFYSYSFEAKQLQL